MESRYVCVEVASGVDSLLVDSSRAAGREIIVPHEREIRPCTAVRNVVIQSSLGRLQDGGYYERYLKLIDPKVLEDLMSSLAPGWTPIELALAHYEACDKLGLSQEEQIELGRRIGTRLQETALVTAAKHTRNADFDLWTAEGSLHRMWGRLYQGGSCQVIKLGPKDKLLEFRSFALSRYRYYRYAQLAGIGAAYAALGAHIESMQIVSYNVARDELSFHYTWR